MYIQIHNWIFVWKPSPQPSDRFSGIGVALCYRFLDFSVTERNTYNGGLLMMIMPTTTIRVDDDLKMRVRFRCPDGSFSDGLRELLNDVERLEGSLKESRDTITTLQYRVSPTTSGSPVSFAVPSVRGGMTDEYWDEMRRLLDAYRAPICKSPETFPSDCRSDAGVTSKRL